MTQAQAKVLALRVADRIARKMPRKPGWKPSEMPKGGGGRLISTRPPSLRRPGFYPMNPPPGLRGLGASEEAIAYGASELLQAPGATQIVPGSIFAPTFLSVEPSASASSQPSLSTQAVLKLPATPVAVKAKSALSTMAVPAVIGVVAALLGLKLFTH